MFVIKHRKIFLIFTAIMVVASITLLFTWGLKEGIDFAGGSILEVSYPDGRPTLAEAQSRVNNLPIGNYSIRPIGDNGYVARTRFLSEDERIALVNSLSLNGSEKIVEERFNSIGPTVGQELKNKAYVAIAISILAIVLFITFAFRKVSKPVSSWKYGIVSIIALVHDILIPTGVFVILIKYAGAEVDMLFVGALLAILGYSINDTIIVFDRIRENLDLVHRGRVRESFKETIGKSLNQTYRRSFNTSFTTIIVVFALYLFGGAVTQNFALTLIVGIVAGAYSSIFLAPPILLMLSGETKTL
ncbi:protein translocase subunit SecF [Patescibacteria group bacterium]|nr:protein translocase subunit SecF [Patescibacteria group bacterium]MBU4057559.1 protein translocase subunit SecF [Patescibacteria group bacterium]MBU4115591.1 protein translocase subunit SecF [Patescibacteria group bacterium]